MLRLELALLYNYLRRLEDFSLLSRNLILSSSSTFLEVVLYSPILKPPSVGSSGEACSPKMVYRSSGRAHADLQRHCWLVAVQRPPHWNKPQSCRTPLSTEEAPPPLSGWDYGTGTTAMKAPELQPYSRVLAHHFLVASSHSALYLNQSKNLEIVQDFLETEE